MMMRMIWIKIFIIIYMKKQYVKFDFFPEKVFVFNIRLSHKINVKHQKRWALRLIQILLNQFLVICMLNNNQKLINVSAMQVTVYVFYQMQKNIQCVLMFVDFFLQIFSIYIIILIVTGFIIKVIKRKSIIWYSINNGYINI